MKKNWNFFGIQNERFSCSSPLYEGLHLQGPLKNFLYGLQTCSDYVTTSSNFRIYNDTKTMAFGLLEKIGHMFLKKLYPHLPFESYFSIYKSRLFYVYLQVAKRVLHFKVSTHGCCKFETNLCFLKKAMISIFFWENDVVLTCEITCTKAYKSSPSMFSALLETSTSIDR